MSSGEAAMVIIQNRHDLGTDKGCVRLEWSELARQKSLTGLSVGFGNVTKRVSQRMGSPEHATTRIVASRLPEYAHVSS